MPNSYQPMSTKQSEEALLQAVASGSRTAFSDLYERHLNGLCRYAGLFVQSPEEAEEIVQEVFVRIWARRATLPQVASFKAYVYQITRNLMVDYWRQQQRQTLHWQQFQAESATSEPADTALIFRQDYQMAQQAIAQLPPKRKQIFLLKTQQELSLDEIAQQLSISKPVVKKQLYAATAFVKAYLQRHGGWSFGAICLAVSLCLHNYVGQVAQGIQGLIRN